MLALLALLAPQAAAAAPDPGAPDDFAPDRSWDIEHLHLDVAIDPEAREVRGTATFTVRALWNDAETLTLDQRGLSVEAVRVDGAAAPFELTDETLEITLPRPEDVAAAAPLEVAIDYSTRPRSGLHFRGPGRASPDTYTEVWSQGEHADHRYWFPLWDYPNDRLTFSGRFTVPEGMKVLSNGEGGFDGEAWSYRLEQDMVSYLPMFAAADYQVREAAWDGIPVRQWYPPDATAEEVESVSANVPEMMAFFSEITGLRYPYPSYTEVFVQGFLYTGMENTTATIQARKLLHPEGWRDAMPFAESVAAHELAHQWYGDALTCRTWQDLWLNEGFATFFAARWMGHRFGDAQYYATVMRWHDGARGGPPMSTRWWSGEADYGDNWAVYAKGASVLQMLRATLGEEAFWAGIRAYTTENAHRLVDTEDLRRAFEDVTGRHLGWFFDQWTHLPGSPTLDLSWQWRDGVLTAKVRQQHKPDGDSPLFYLPIDLEIGAGEETVERRFWLDAAEAEFSVDLAEKPAYVAFDPKAAVLGTLNVDQSAAAWRAQAGSPSPYARLRALEAMAGGKRDPETEALLAARLLDAAAPLPERERAAASLGALSAGQEVLIAALEDPHPLVRTAAASALGNPPGRPGADALARLARRDPVPTVQAAAIRALAEVDPDRARPIARVMLSRKADYRGDAQAGAADALGARGTLDDLGAVLSQVGPRVPRAPRHAAADAAAKIALREAGEVNAEFTLSRVARALEPMLESDDLRTRRRGVALLAQVGDDETLRRLKALEEIETVPDVLESIKTASEAIRTRDLEGAAASERAAMARRLEELEERLKALEAAPGEAR